MAKIYFADIVYFLHKYMILNKFKLLIYNYTYFGHQYTFVCPKYIFYINFADCPKCVLRLKMYTYSLKYLL